MTEVLAYDFMQRALLAALLVGLSAPMVGIFLVQRRLALVGDGMGHVALSGVAVGVVTGTAPLVTALVLAVAAAVGIELVRARGRTSGDVALAVMFYGGIALGVVLMGLDRGDGAVTLDSYLFGSITTTSGQDLAVFAVLAAVITLTTWVLRPRLFAAAGDEEYARATGLPVTALNLVLAVLTAVTVVLSMRVVGLLLISALMVVPNATAQLVSHSFAATMRRAVLVGVVCSVGGVVASFYADTPSGGTIVVLTVAVFLATAVATALARRLRAHRHRSRQEHPHDHGPDCGHPAVVHGDHVDYLHDGEHHAAHDDHWDQHPSAAAAAGTERGGR